MQLYAPSLTEYKRLKTLEVKVGDLVLGNFHPIRVQTMTTTDTMDTLGTVEQSIRCIEAGAEMVRITAPSKKEAENLESIRNALRARGYHTPLVADIHFTPNAAEIAARIVEKVRVNPGNYVDKKKFAFIDYTDADYLEELDRIRERFLPLIAICKQYGTAMRIGTNHGSLSDRIMSRYGDTPTGMVESAMEFLRIARDEQYHQIVLSMKASNPQVMVQAYRLLVRQMEEEFGVCYPLHLGVTEAGDGEDGRIKSAIGIGTLLEDGLGDTIRVSLTEDPELEIPVCRDIVKRYTHRSANPVIEPVGPLPYDPFHYQRRATDPVGNIGGTHVPVVMADLSHLSALRPEDLKSIGYTYDGASDKWNIADTAADYIYTGGSLPSFALPGTLKVVADAAVKGDRIPFWEAAAYSGQTGASGGAQPGVHFVRLHCSDAQAPEEIPEALLRDPGVVLCLTSDNPHAMAAVRRTLVTLQERGSKRPVLLMSTSAGQTADEHLIQFATETGALLLDGMGDGVFLRAEGGAVQVSGRNYQEQHGLEGLLNNTAFSILQATRTRISKTEYISCPSCGRTLFELQETTARIRSVTHHLKGVKIAIMGCIVNGPGEMADADFGYVGSGVGKITLYKGKDIVKRNIDSTIAVEELIGLIKDNGAWVEPA
ncbi:(E)-4-hydroxy-3-methylbut-2-enyl-diphosphate synthase [Dinghuibacter silviterrae]|uniref:4-hydroxy-3-methylbut-2-en-1-yl diphosphate synthase (flavodoxin) n=1 Tax=Dinghuibacter silviterrae TaxID=1539049 RepID=A0A4R8DPA0_9BACT|nr:(E)-4-hydroxy-3-methylbut-2-enyl-diphosphate synthase [Dinghuibacter silviterrae]TDW99527.1 4-hydroxy-3-methylbut-2-en-1-yl diphosphate synthase [Dinghuibacter silviterrae]